MVITIMGIIAIITVAADGELDMVPWWERG